LLCGEAASSAAAARQAGFSCIKLKADGRDMPRVCATLREVRDVVGAPMRIRIDLNSAWTVDEAIDWIPRLAAYGIEYIEQPVASVAELSRVRSVVDVPIAADECVTSEAAVRTIAAAGAADVIVVKPGWIGLTQAMGIARAAEECGLDVVVTSTLDTSIGISAALHVAAALPEPLRHCGLATAPLLAGDLVRDALVPVRGSLRLPDGSGLGVRVDTDAIARWRIDTGQAAAAL
jgi:O-succinylbenzoate synthase